MSRLPGGSIRSGGPQMDFGQVSQSYGGNPISTGDIGAHVRDRSGAIRPLQSKVAQMEPYFGKAKRVEPEDPYDNYDVENFDLPDTFAGKSTYLSYVLVSNIISSNLWPVQRLLPWLKHDDSNEIIWDRWEFHDSLLKRTPEESVSRLLTSTFGTHRAYIVRYGIALLLEHGFYLTEKGRLNYAMNLTQMRHAVVETSCMGVMMAILMADPFKDPHDRYRPNNNKSMLQLDQILREEVEFFACVQKTEDGFNLINEKLNNILMERNQELNNIITVVPSGMAKYYKNRAEHRPFMYSGKPAGHEAPSILSGGYGDVEESRGFKMGEHQPNEDPNFREQVIGGVYQQTMVHLQDIPPEEFRTTHMNKYVHSETTDDWWCSDYKVNCEFVGLYERWSSIKPYLSKIGKKFLGPYKTWGAVGKAAGVIDMQIKAVLASKPEVYKEFVRIFVDGGDRHQHGAASSTNSKTQAATPPPARFSGGGPVGGPVVSRNGYGTTFTKDVTIPVQNPTLTYPKGTVDPVYRFRDASKQDLFAQQTYCDKPGTNICSLDQQKFGKMVGNFVVVIDTKGKSQTECLIGAVANKDHRDMFVLNWILSYYLARIMKSKQAGQVMTQTLVDTLLKPDNIVSNIASASNGATEMTPAELINKGFDRLQKAGYCRTTKEALENSLVYYSLLACMARTLKIPIPPLDASKFAKKLSKQGVELTDPKEIAACLQDPAVLVSCVDRYIELLNAPANGAATSSGFQVSYEDISSDARETKKAGLTDAQKANATLTEEKMPDLLAEIDQSEQRATSREQGGSGETLVSQFQDAYTALAIFCAYHCQMTWNEVQLLIFTVHTFASAVKKSKAKDADSVEDVMSQLLMALFRFPLGQSPGDPIVNSLYVPLIALLKAPLPTGQTPKKAAEEWEKLHHKELYAIVLHVASGEDARSDQIRSTIKQGGSVKQLLQSLNEHIPSTFYRDEDSDAQLLRPVGERNSYSVLIHGRTDLNDAIKEISKTDLLFEAYHMVRNQQGGITLDEKAVFDKVFASCNTGKYDPDFLQACIIATMASAAHGVNATRTDPFADTSSAVKNIVSKVFPLATDLNKILRVNKHIAKMGRIESWRDYALSFSAASLAAPGGATVAQNADRMSYQEIYKLLMESVSVQDATWWQWGNDNNIPPAIGWFGFRPHQRYLMGTMFKAVKGGATGYTFHGHADFQLADNVAQKMHYGHFTINIKSVVLQNKNVVLGRNVYCKQYLGGGGHAIWDPCSIQDKHDYRANELHKDIFLVAVLSNHKQDNWHMDITGSYAPTLKVNASVNENTSYPSAPFYAEHWGWGNPVDPTRCTYYGYPAAKTNTIVCQEHETAYNHGMKRFVPYKINKGHWGDRVYPGCGQVRRGTAMFLKVCSYDGTAYFQVGN